MSDTASTILTLVFGLASTLSFFYVLYLLVREKGILHGILGFIFPIYPFLWGWLRGSRQEFLDIMVFWTFTTIGAVAFPLVMVAISGPSLMPMIPVGPSANLDDFAAPSFSDEVNQRGSITRGGQVRGDLQDVFAVDEWTFSGSAGQAVRIRCQPAPASRADPRIALLGPNGAELASDDDGGGNLAALIDGYSLPADGTYLIHVDVWSTGAYLLSLE